MKVAVINFSGNVGKTTIAGHLLAPRMQNAPIFSVESVNLDARQDGIDVEEQVRGGKFGDLQEELMRLDDAIVDIGASNVEQFVKLMQQYHGSHEDFDFFVVPVVKEKKQQADTINTINVLQSMGVPAKKIRVVFNMVDADESVESEFPAILGLAMTAKNCTAKQEAVVFSNDVFERLKAVKRTLSQIVADETDYRAKLRDTKDEDEKDFAIKMISLKRLAVSANKNMDDVFKILFK